MEENSKRVFIYRPYSVLYDVTNAKDKDEALKLLTYYLKEKWYQGHNDTGWYDSHLNKNDIYNGYWSYESGA